MGEWEFILDMERLFQDNPMKKESFEKILLYEITCIEFYPSRDPKSPGASFMSWRRGSSWVLINILHSEYEMEESFAHEVAHIYYTKRISRLFRKYENDYRDNSEKWTAHISHLCEEDLIDWAAMRFCRENPGYVKGVLSDIILGRAYPQIRTEYVFR